MNAARSLIRWSLFAIPALLAAATLQRGDTVDDVYAAMGKPKGRAEAGDRQLLYYDRGEVELREGVVTRVSLLSEEQLADRDARRAEAEERRQASNAEGEEIKAQRLADESFQKASPAVQLAYWQDFSRRYPGVTCVDQIAFARARLNEQQAQERVRAEQERLAVEESMRRTAPQQEVYGIDPYLYGYGYGYGYGGYGRRGHRGHGGRYFDGPEVEPRQRPGNTGNGLFSGDPIVQPFSPTPIVAPFRPPSTKIEFASSTDIWPASRQNVGDIRPGGDRDHGQGPRRYR